MASRHSPPWMAPPAHLSVTRVFHFQTVCIDPGRLTIVISYQISNDEPPTPVRTPTSATHDDFFFQTPQIESSFYDPERSWFHPGVQAGNLQQLKTPTPDSEGRDRIERHSSKQDIDNQSTSHVHHFSPDPVLTFPPVESSRQLSSSLARESTRTTDSHTDGSLVTGRKSPRGDNSGSIHTPPPSRNSRRQGFSSQVKRLSASAMADPKRNSNSRLSNMGPPETPSRMMQASPQLFPPLQFSPDPLQPQFSGPASAPVYPHQRLFWDPNLANTTGNTIATQYHDPFAAQQNDFMTSFIPSPAMSHGFENANIISDIAYDVPSSQATIPASPYFGGATFPASFTASPRPPPPAAEDPSLFLSSPARRFGPPPQSFNPGDLTTRFERQPYHHQIEESKREEEIERASKKAKPQRSSGPVQSSNSLRRPASPNAEGRPGLKRSLTDSGAGASNYHLRQQSQVSFSESVSVADGVTKRLSRGGRSSPLKRLSRTSWHSSSERPASRQRTSLTFTIDKDGRAKTLVTTVPETADSHMNSDRDSSDSDADSIDVADFDITRSQNNSFAYPGDEPLHQSYAKCKPEIRNHSKNSSYSSTMTSSNSTYHSSRTSSNIGSAQARSNRPDNALSRAGQSRNSLTRPNHLDKSFLDDDSDDERGDAQHALRAVLKDRPRSTSLQAGLTKRRSGPPPPFHSSPPMQEIGYGVFNASPTTVTDPDLATPSTDRESQASNNSTRCICNSASSDGQYMIQWYVWHMCFFRCLSALTADSESCSKWLHTNCVGIDARQIPAVYICVYCAQTPMRHGRIREPSRAAALAPASPLAHKSSRYR